METNILRYSWLSFITFVPCAAISISRGYNSPLDLMIVYACILLGIMALDLVEITINYCPQKSRAFLKFLNIQVMTAFFFGTILYFTVNYLYPSFQLEYWLAVLATLICSILYEKMN